MGKATVNGTPPFALQDYATCDSSLAKSRWDEGVMEFSINSGKSFCPPRSRPGPSDIWHEAGSGWRSSEVRIICHMGGISNRPGKEMPSEVPFPAIRARVNLLMLSSDAVPTLMSNLAHRSGRHAGDARAVVESGRRPGRVCPPAGRRSEPAFAWIHSLKPFVVPRTEPSRWRRRTAWLAYGFQLLDLISRLFCDVPRARKKACDRL